MTVSELVRPDHFTSVEWSESLGPEVVDLCRMAGFEPYPEQALLLDHIFALDPGDPSRSAAFEAAVIAARQQLKTGLLKQACLGWLLISEVPLVVWSAHEFATAVEAQMDLLALLQASPDLEHEIGKVTVAAGSNAIQMRNGSRVIFRARTSGGGRGLTGDRVILDEAYALRPEHLGAVLPTLIRAPDAQIVYGSSAGLLRSDVLRSLRDRGRAGSDRLVYAEWGTERRDCAAEFCAHRPGTEGCALDDPALQEQAAFISARNGQMETIRALRKALPPQEFAREILVWWEDPAADGGFGVEAWADLETEPARPESPWFAVDVSADHAFAAIVCAGEVDGRIQVQVTERDGVVDHRPGMDWLRGRIAELRESQGDPQFAFMAGSAIEAIVPELEADGAQMVRVSRTNTAAACGLFLDLASSGRLAHLGQDDLTDAAMSAKRKTIGESAFIWTVGGFADLAPLYGASLAVWQWATADDPAANVW